MENNSRLYPLSIAQKNQLYFYNRYSQTNLFNKGISVSFGCNANEEMLRESILEAIARCESMRIRFSKTADGEVMQYINNEEAPVIEAVDFSMLAGFEAENKMKEWTAEPFTVFDKLVPPSYLQGIPRRQPLTIIIHLPPKPYFNVTTVTPSPPSL